MAWKDKTKQKEYWLKVKDKYNALLREKWKNNPEYRRKIYERRKQWVKENPSRTYIQGKLAYAKRLKLRFEVMKRDNFTCQYCGRKAPEVKIQIDHFVPKSKGGKTILENLLTTCGDCNIGKSDVLLN